MFGRFGFIFILLIVLLCTGFVSGSETTGLNVDTSVIPGIVIMIAALILSAAAPKLVKKMPSENRQTAGLLIRLGSVALCGIGAIAVFCG